LDLWAKPPAAHVIAPSQADGEEDEELNRRVTKVGPSGRVTVVRQQQQQQQPTRIILDFVSTMLQHLNPRWLLRDMLLDPDHIDPALEELINNTQITWRLQQPLKTMVINARQHLRPAATQQQLSSTMVAGQCPCSAYAQHYKTVDHEGTPHVCTRDLSIIAHEPLRTLLAKGLNHIPTAPAAAEDVVDTLSQAVVQFGTHAERAGLPPLPDWVYSPCHVRQRVEHWMAANKPPAHLMPAVELTPDLHSELARLKSTFWLCEVDKAAADLCVVCPFYATHLILQRLEGPDFVRVPLTQPEVVTSMREQLAQIDPGLTMLVDAEAPLPIMRTTFKSHKLPPSWRYLTAGSGAMLTPLNSTVQQVCTALFQAAEQALCQPIDAGLPSPCIMVNNAQHMTLNLPNRIWSFMTADITKCFEAIPIDRAAADGLPTVLAWLVGLAFEQYKDAHGCADPRLSVSLSPGRPGANFVTRPGRATAMRAYLTSEQTLELLCLAVASGYVEACGQVFRQTKGIPMGADYSPLLCNVYLLYWEIAAMKRHANLIQPPVYRALVLEQWRYVYRLIDDVCWLNGTDLAAWVLAPRHTGSPTHYTWVYPECLQVEVTAVHGPADWVSGQPFVRFDWLDLLVRVRPDGTYNHTVYLPHVKLPFQPIRSIAAVSLRPQRVGYNTVIGSLYRGLYLCSTKRDFREYMVHVIVGMEQRGFCYKRLVRMCIEWIQSNSLPRLPMPTVAYIDMLRSLLL
jgi:hypothetical protein